jgi:stage II sporulation protein R
MKKAGRAREAFRGAPHRLEWVVWGAMAIAAALLIFTELGGESVQPALSDEILRLHVVANSDSEQDQAIKLEVRDGLQRVYAARWEAAPDGATCRQWARQDQTAMEQYVNELLEERGADYRARIELGVFDFPDRVYEDTVELPQGSYHAVRVILGDGAGQNWWCVLYPPLCLPQDGVTGDDENGNGQGQPLEVRSWILEQLPENWQNCLRDFWIGRCETQT